MESVAHELLSIINDFVPKINRLSEAEFSAKPVPHKWSKKEVLGHLIDSAHNNLRRFVTGQYESQPPKIVYDQDFWVKVNGYQTMEKPEVIMFWKLMNERIAAVMLSMEKSNYNRTIDTDKEGVQLHNLEWLAVDYVKHLKHHLNQIIPGSFDVIYN